MSIRMALATRTSGLDNALNLLDHMNDIVLEVAQETYRGFAEPLRRRLSEEPGPVKLPVRWTSEKQRRAYFATDGFGHGIPYNRSHQLPAAWSVDIIEEPGTFKILIYNTAPQSKYVYGPLGRFSDQSVRQQMHIDTGWPDAKAIIDIYHESMTNFFLDRLRQRIGEFSSTTRTRAYTGG